MKKIKIKCVQKIKVENYGVGSRWYCPLCDSNHRSPSSRLLVTQYTNSPPPVSCPRLLTVEITNHQVIITDEWGRITSPHDAGFEKFAHLFDPYNYGFFNDMQLAALSKHIKTRG